MLSRSLLTYPVVIILGLFSQIIETAYLLITLHLLQVGSFAVLYIS